MSTAAVPPLNALGEPLRAVQSRTPPDIGCAADYERHAIHHIAAPVWHHIQSGSDHNVTLQHNRAAFDALRLLPQPIAQAPASTTSHHTRVELLGHTLSSPLLLAPVAYQRLVHPEGEIATVRAATALHTCMVASTLSSYTLEDIARAADTAGHEMGQRAPRWFQLYLQPQRAHNLTLLRRAEAAGYTAIVWTVDAAIKRSGFPLPPDVHAVNLEGMTEPSPTTTLQGPMVFGTPWMQRLPSWEDLQWLRAHTTLPLIVKGVLSPQQAAHAVALGADALIVSNHGGRVLDGVVSPLQVLPAIRRAVGPAVPLLLDSGVRHGTDIAKALALGANAVLIGRLQLHALATAGLLGVAHLLHLLRTELELAMVQLGCTQVSDLSAAHLWHCESAPSPSITP